MYDPHTVCYEKSQVWAMIREEDAVSANDVHEKTAAEKIDDRITELGDWRGAILARLRGIIKQAIPDLVEDWKWRGVPTWYSGGGIICTG